MFLKNWGSIIFKIHYLNFPRTVELWKISSIYKSAQNSLMNPHVAIVCFDSFQLLAGLVRATPLLSHYCAMASYHFIHNYFSPCL